MTFEQRRELKHLLDQHKRTQIQVARGRANLCAGCGAEYANQTSGCKSCHDRKRRRQRRRQRRTVLDAEVAA